MEPESVAATLQVSDLHVQVGRRRLLRGVSLHVDAGERVALVGPSGSGKSLTVGAVLGTLGAAYQVRGGLRIHDRPVDVRRAAGRRGVAAVHQASATALNPLVRVGSQLAGAVRAQQRCSRREAREQAVDLLGTVELGPELLRRYPAELSGGQRQRVCLAVALACRPRLLVADEPTTALDTVARARVVRVLDDLCARTGAGLLLVTHEPEVAHALDARVVRLAEGAPA